MTKVIHIRDLPGESLAHWRQWPPEYLYIGRPSPLGNPFSIPRDGTREQVIEKFKRHTLGRIHSVPKGRWGSEEFIQALRNARGKTLVCFCKPEACHGDVIIELLDSEPALRAGVQVSEGWFWCRCGREQINAGEGWDTCSSCLREA